MSANSRPARPKVLIFRPCEYDREQIKHAREVIKFAKRVLAESEAATSQCRPTAGAPVLENQLNRSPDQPADKPALRP